MEGNTVRAKGQEGGIPVGPDLKENRKKRTEEEIEIGKENLFLKENRKRRTEKEIEERNLWSMIWPADTVLVACVNVSFILNMSLNDSI